MLTPTIEAVARRAYSRAALPLEVKIDVAFALGCACITAIASSREPTGVIEATGPKISSRPIVIVGGTPSKSVGPEEEPVRTIRDRVPAAVQHQPGAFGDPGLDVAEDAVPMRRADDGPHRDAGLRAVPDPERPRRLREPVPRLGVRRADRSRTLPARQRSPAQP